jgi:hypothetical protein
MSVIIKNDDSSKNSLLFGGPNDKLSKSVY